MQKYDSELEEEKQEITRLLRASLKRRRESIVFDVARGLYSLLKDKRFNDLCSKQENRSSGSGAHHGEAWIRIESLSQLRAAVGGRFRNLREKWVKAGFPLRVHRGDRTLAAELHPEGWMVLADWISKQGFDSRLAPADETWLFEVKAKQDN